LSRHAAKHPSQRSPHATSPSSRDPGRCVRCRPRPRDVRLHGVERRPRHKAGKGEGTISGYTVSGVAYTLASSNPANIDSVTFTLSAAATTVKAKLVQASSTYTSCAVSGGTSVTCDFSPDVAVLSADELSVVAIQ
jgi:hypothetical protein